MAKKKLKFGLSNYILIRIGTATIISALLVAGVFYLFVDADIFALVKMMSISMVVFVLLYGYIAFEGSALSKKFTLFIQNMEANIEEQEFIDDNHNLREMTNIAIHFNHLLEFIKREEVSAGDGKEDNKAQKSLGEIYQESQFIQNIMDLQEDGIVVLRDHKVYMANRTFLNWIGREDMEDFKNRDVFVANTFKPYKDNNFYLNEIKDDKWVEAVAKDTTGDYQVAIEDKVIQLNVNSLEGKGEVVVINMMDVTDMIGAQEELRKKDQIMQSQSAQAGMGELINSIAHQWRQPLNEISLEASNISFAAQLGEDEEVITKHANNIVGLTDRMSQTITDYIDMASSTGKITNFKLQAIFDTIGSLMESQFFLRNITYEVYCDEFEIESFRNFLHQVVLNIINNAIQAFPKEGTGEKLIQVLAEVQGDMAIITIADNAGGIDPDNLPKIFESHFTTKAESDGASGLGLHIVETLLETKLFGEIEASNTEMLGDQGAMFVIKIPLDISDKAEAEGLLGNDEDIADESGDISSSDDTQSAESTLPPDDEMIDIDSISGDDFDEDITA